MFILKRIDEIPILLHKMKLDILAGALPSFALEINKVQFAY